MSLRFHLGPSSFPLIPFIPFHLLSFHYLFLIRCIFWEVVVGGVVGYCLNVDLVGFFFGRHSLIVDLN